MLDSVDDALAAVPLDRYARQPSGEQLPQSSALEIIAAMLRLLAVQPGMRVLEVGIGSDVGCPSFDQVQLRTARQAHGWRVQATMPTRRSHG